MLYALGQSLRLRYVGTFLNSSEINSYSSGNYDFAVVMPSLNEANNLETLLPAIQKVLMNQSYLIIVVSDGSTDGTADLCKHMDGVLLINKKRCSGGGDAIRIGIVLSATEY